MVRQKIKKTVESIYTEAVTPPGSLSTTIRFDENCIQNSKSNKVNNNGMKEKLGTCIHNPVTCRRKKSNGKKYLDKKDKKTLMNEETALGKSRSSEALHAKKYSNFENEKDEDTEEFFGIIKETVEAAVKTSLHDLINRNLGKISIKLDNIWDRLNAHENFLDKIKAELTNKIIHYGEENSRHFRYLCMKSEYDKMFYQHQNLMTTIPIDARSSDINSFTQNLVRSNEPLDRKSLQQHQPKHQPMNNCSSKPNKTSNREGFTDFDCTQNSKLSLISKSSDVGIREVKQLLEQLQKFYSQHDHEKQKTKHASVVESLEVQEQNYSDIDDSNQDEDEVEADESSDVLSSQSIEENIEHC